MCIRDRDDKVESGVKILNMIPPGTLTPEITESLINEIQGRGDGGGTIGSFPLTRIRVTLLSAEVTEESNDMAFSIAAGEAFEEALRTAGPTLLEPLMSLKIITPDDFYGDFVSDLNQRRSQIVNTDVQNGLTFISAHAPLAELFGYSSAMRSLSQGRAGTSMEPLGYAAAPQDVIDGFAI